MFKMLDLSIELQSTEKSDTISFKDTFLESTASNLSDMLSI